ncbi:hypothetical protein M0813_04835 [Anaeramoeba flamelloides]|uniref:Tyrosine-protein kinase ephrin type A/B receptor-like domain-containing protein n=1 Tax=Anaeramoeba flamelloides TaxID=1746091 RepID=A0ABQ8XI66_9EUKA|nr:hypothetical protein M0813_04835 [Anaeramoeba flamelloides]
MNEIFLSKTKKRKVNVVYLILILIFFSGFCLHSNKNRFLQNNFQIASDNKKISRQTESETKVKTLTEEDLGIYGFFRPTIILKNKGQISDPHIKYYSQALETGTTFWFYDDKIIIRVKGHIIRMKLHNESCLLKSVQPGVLKNSTSTVIKGSKKYTHIPNYEKIVYTTTTPGVSLEFGVSKDNKKLKSAFLLDKAGDYQTISMRYESQTLLPYVSKSSGELFFFDPVQKNAPFSESAPIFYQGSREIKGSFTQHFPNRDTISFKIAKNQHFSLKKPLVIDPWYTTYLGSSDDDQSWKFVLNSIGEFISVGITLGNDFPITDRSYQNEFKGEDYNCFLFKMTTGMGLNWSTFISSDEEDQCKGITLDDVENIVITGWTYGIDGDEAWPTTKDTCFPTTQYCDRSGFVTKLNSVGTDIIWSTFTPSSLNDTNGFRGRSVLYDSPTDSLFLVGYPGEEVGSCSPTGIWNYTGEYNGWMNIRNDGLGFNCFNGLGDNYRLSVPSKEDILTYSDSLYFTTLFGVEDPYGESVQTFDKECMPQYSTSLGIKAVNYYSIFPVDNETYWIVGNTLNDTFPTTSDAFQKNFSNNGSSDGILLKYESKTNLVYSSFFGFTGFVKIHQIKVDSNQRVIIAGSGSPLESYDQFYGKDLTHKNGFIVVLNSTGNGLIYSIGFNSPITNLELFKKDQLESIIAYGYTYSENISISEQAYQNASKGNDELWIFANHTVCPMGSYLYDDMCTPCRAGSNSTNTGATDVLACELCNEGTFSELGSSICRNCFQGTYNPLPGGNGPSSCILCEGGTYSDQEGATSISVCQNCQEGTYSDSGNSKCLDCPMGTYNPNQRGNGTSSCILCEGGTYGDQERATSISVCQNCQEGTYSDSGNSQCLDCPMGTYNPNQQGNGLDSCQFCDGGFYNNITGQSSCFECLEGEYTNSTGSINCLKCSLGTYNPYKGGSTVGDCQLCYPGAYSDDEGSIVCKLCPQGTWNHLFAQTSLSNCQNCPTGTYGVKDGGVSSTDGCDYCPPGKYNDMEGSVDISFCIACPVAHYSDHYGAISNETCKPCPKGTWNDQGGLISLGKCIDCSPGEYNDLDASTKCQICGIGTYPNIKQTTCLNCSAGTFASKAGSEVCESCPSDSININTGATKCFKCADENICIGGSECSTGRDPESYCAKCLPNYFIRGNDCKECPPTWTIYIWLGVGFLILILIVIFFKKVKKAILKLKDQLITITIVSLQIIGGILAMNLPFPDFLMETEVGTASGFFNLDVEMITGSQCFKTFSFYQRYLIFMIMPLAVIVLLIIIWFVLKLLERFHHFTKDKALRLRNITIFYGTMIFRFIYIPISIVCFEPFDYTYQPLLDENTLDKDPNITTSDEDYQHFLPWFVFFALLYVVGVPLTLFILLLFAKKNRFNERWKSKIGWLWSHYKAKRFWWEITGMIFRLLFMITPLFFSLNKTMHSVSLLVIIAVQTIFILAFRPRTHHEKRTHKAMKRKLEPPDKLQIGFCFIIFGVISLTLPSAGMLLFVLFYGVGVIFLTMTFKSPLRTLFIWLKISTKKKRNKKKNQSEDINLKTVSYSSNKESDLDTSTATKSPNDKSEQSDQQNSNRGVVYNSNPNLLSDQNSIPNSDSNSYSFVNIHGNEKNNSDINKDNHSDMGSINNEII